jgi:hypothetical protein
MSKQASVSKPVENISETETLAKRYVNSGVLNRTEAEATLRLPKDQQVTRLKGVEQQIESVRRTAVEASKHGIINHSEFMELYHSANAAAEPGKAPVRYSVEERIGRAKALVSIISEYKSKILTLEDARDKYETREVAQNKYDQYKFTNQPAPAAVVPQAVPPVAATQEDPKPQPQQASNTPQDAGTIPASPPVTPPTIDARIGNVLVFLRADGDVYGSFKPDTIGKKSETSYLVSDAPAAQKFRQDVIKPILEQDAFIQGAFQGRSITVHFCKDTRRALPKEVSIPKAPQAFVIVNPEEDDAGNELPPMNSKSIKLYLNPAILEDPAKALKAITYELTRTAMLFKDSSMTETEALQHVKETLKKILPTVQDAKIQKNLEGYLK